MLFYSRGRGEQRCVFAGASCLADRHSVLTAGASVLPGSASLVICFCLGSHRQDYRKHRSCIVGSVCVVYCTCIGVCVEVCVAVRSV